MFKKVDLTPYYKAPAEWELKLIKYFQTQKIPYWIVAIPLIGSCTYLKFAKSYFKLLEERQYISRWFFWFHFLIHFVFMITILLFCFTLTGSMISLFEDLLSKEQFGLIVFSVFMGISIFNFIWTPLVIKLLHKNIVTSYANFYLKRIGITLPFARINIGDFSFDVKNIFKRLSSKKIAKFDEFSFISEKKVTPIDAFLFPLLMQKGMLNSDAYVDFVVKNNPQFLKNYRQIYHNFYLRFCSASFFGLIYLINQLNPIFKKSYLYTITFFHTLKAFLFIIVFVMIIIGWMLLLYYGFFVKAFYLPEWFLLIAKLCLCFCIVTWAFSSALLDVFLINKFRNEKLKAVLQNSKNNRLLTTQLPFHKLYV